LGFGVETEGVISAPLFSLLVESVHAKRHLGWYAAIADFEIGYSVLGCGKSGGLTSEAFYVPGV